MRCVMGLLRIALLAIVCFQTVSGRAGVRVVDLSECRSAYDPADMTPFIRELLAKERDGGDLRILFPRGVYHFHPEFAFGKYHAVTNHDNGCRYFAFPLVKCRNVEIDGGGSEFIFHGQIIPFLIENSCGITLRNLTIDWQVPFTLEGRVIRRDTLCSTVEIEVPDEFGPVCENGKLIMRGEGWEERMLGENIVFDPRTGATAYRSDDYYIPKPDNYDIPAVETAPGRYELHTRFVRALPPVGTGRPCEGLFARNRGSRAIHATGSSGLLVEDVTIHHAGGMGLIAERSENITVRRMRVTLREGSSRMITTTADATHFCNCRGLVLVEDCLFENMLDDATNVHGTYVRIVELPAPGEVVVRINHPQQAGFDFAGPGDRLEAVDGETLLPRAELVVTASEPINPHYIRLFFEPVSGAELRVGDGLENMSWYPELIFRRNTVRNNRARSMLVSTPRRVLIEENTFSSMMAAILFEGDMDHWYESGAVRDVTIRRNRFLDGTYGGADFPTIFINPHQRRMVPGEPYERNIRIEENLFRTFNEQLLRARSVGGLIFRGNTIEQSDTYRPYNQLPTVDVRGCEEVVIEDNRYCKPGRMRIVQEDR